MQDLQAPMELSQLTSNIEWQRKTLALNIKNQNIQENNKIGIKKRPKAVPHNHLSNKGIITQKIRK